MGRPAEDDQQAEARKEAEAFFVTLALGVAGIGVLILYYVATPVQLWLRSAPSAVELAPEALSAPEQVDAAGAHVALGPLELDYRQAGIRVLRQHDFARSSYAAYVPVRDASGRVVLVVRQEGFDDPAAVPRGRVRIERATGMLVRGAPLLLAGVEEWPGDPLGGQPLEEVWILLMDEHPPDPGNVAPAAALGLALVLVPVLGIAAYYRRRGR